MPIPHSSSLTRVLWTKTSRFGHHRNSDDPSCCLNKCFSSGFFLTMHTIPQLQTAIEFYNEAIKLFESDDLNLKATYLEKRSQCHIKLGDFNGG